MQAAAKTTRKPAIQRIRLRCMEPPIEFVFEWKSPQGRRSWDVTRAQPEQSVDCQSAIGGPRGFQGRCNGGALWSGWTEARHRPRLDTRVQGVTPGSGEQCPMEGAEAARKNIVS